ncbi:hypothetical protein AQS8620_01615 [Aquimixticola soesokkakensis]|uniref:Uncharacterized protein n=1 Tax=Aquimixticola soesokkakensis TaxID=1519096 RepID=A0A1Y5SIT3_9RHOB|nr:hypothetical protein [Aquimixticola soesokkakensis]SLN41654.1 hypothetical protein AQS8620_01615 [Aquimixticola soesokkakensis]
MSATNDLADALARDTIEAMAETGDDQLVAEVARVIGATSTTTQEAFLTAARVRMAEQRGRAFLEARIREIRTGSARTEAPQDSGND